MLIPTRLLFVVNRTKPDAERMVCELQRVAEQAGAHSRVSYAYPLDPQLLDDRDLCVVVGGDGTLLGVVDAVAPTAIPVLGVNLGRLGFMASFSPDEALQQLQRVLTQGPECRELSLLAGTGAGLNGRIALNDWVIKGQTSRLIRLRVYCEEEEMNTYHADGVIFSTPTGSTAYNLSAGGPIVHPSARVITVTPINPHTLSARPIVLDERHSLRVEQIGEPQLLQVSADGCKQYEGILREPIELKVCPQQRLRLVEPANYSHYAVLRDKLRWSGDAVFS